MRFTRSWFITVTSLLVAACSDDPGTIDVFERTASEADLSCREVCVDRLDEADDCADVASEDGAPAVACLAPSDNGPFDPNYERALTLVERLEVEADLDCMAICASAVRADKTVILSCADSWTVDGDAAVLCAYEWEQPASTGW